MFLYITALDLQDEAEIREMIKQCDTNEDGVIDFQVPIQQYYYTGACPSLIHTLAF